MSISSDFLLSSPRHQLRQRKGLIRNPQTYVGGVFFVPHPTHTSRTVRKVVSKILDM